MARDRAEPFRKCRPPVNLIVCRLERQLPGGDAVPGLDQFQLTGNAAEFYDRLPARYLLGPWSQGLVAAAEIRPDEQVLDLACGTGVVTRAAAVQLGPKGSVTGLDLNPGMLEVAKAHGNPGSCKMQWVEASALETGLPDASFDVVLCQQGFQFFPDQPKALAETRRILKDGGRLYFSVWAKSGPYNDAVAAALRAHVDAQSANRYLQARNVPGAGELEAIFVAAGFRDVTISQAEMKNRIPDVASFVAVHLLGTPIADKVGELSQEERTALGATAAEGLAEYADGVDAVVPDFINLVAARK